MLVLLPLVPSHSSYTAEEPLNPPKIAPISHLVTESDVSRINGKIEAISAKTGVSATLMKTLVARESQYNVYAKGDGNYTCPLTGKKAPSYGLAQISTCWHPEVSVSQSLDEEFALNFMADLLLKGQCKQWSTCRHKDG